MTCKKIEARLPLHVGGDLPAREAKLVGLHLSTCLSCRRSFESLRSSHAWLRAQGEPAISDAAMDRMRHRMRSHLAEQSARSALSRWLDRQWVSLRRLAAQPVVAVPAMFVLVMGTTLALRGAGLRDTDPLLRTPELPVVAATNTLEDELAQELWDGPPAGAAFDPDRVLASAETDGLAESDEDVVEDSANDGNDLRIELHTGDPNVRIIWFTPNEGETVKN